jgi:hypothetical protein
MTKEEKQILNKAYQIISKKFGGGKDDCKGYDFRCHQCERKRFLETFKSLKDFYLD